MAQGKSDAGVAQFLILPARCVGCMQRVGVTIILSSLCRTEADTSRNPLDNHEAWVRYATQHSVVPPLPLRDFVAAWAEHHNFWYNLGVPCSVYRYEDLVDNPMRVLRQLLENSGLWERGHLSETDLLRTAAQPRLQSYRRKQLGGDTRIKDDIFNSYKKVVSIFVDMWIIPVGCLYVYMYV